MNRDKDVYDYVENPSLLADTFRQVIEELAPSGEDKEKREQEAQLRPALTLLLEQSYISRSEVAFLWFPSL